MTVTDAVNVAQLVALDVANATITYDVDLSDTAAALSASNAETFINNRNVTVSDNATIAQLNTIDANNGSGTVTYTQITDSAANLVLNTGARILGGIAVTVNDAATIAQLAAIDTLVTGTPVYTQITDTAANLLANSGGYVTGSVTVKVSDTGTLEAATLTSIDGLTTTVVDALWSLL